MSGEPSTDPLAPVWDWYAAAIDQDNRERRGPVLTALGDDGDWNEQATAEGWPPGKEVPV